MREAIFPRTLGATLLAFLLVAVSFVMVVPVGAASSASFEFRFANGTVLADSTGGGDYVVPNAFFEAFYAPDPVPFELPLTIHVSCSESFPGGWASEANEFPKADLHSDWQIDSYRIDRVTGQTERSCGETFEPASITVVKQTDPATAAEFSFAVAGMIVPAPGTSGTDWTPYDGGTKSAAGNGGSASWLGLSTGEYTLTELIGLNPDEYDFESVSCDMPFELVEPTTEDPNPGVAFDLLGGEHVTCTFLNESDSPPPTQLTVVKETVPSNTQNFWFDLDGDWDNRVGISGDGGEHTWDLEPGTYNLAEHLTLSQINAGWRLTDSSCDNDDDPALVSLEEGDQVTCTFVNKKAAVDIEKATNDQDADTPTGPQIVVGSTVTWTYVVTNTGNVALTGVAVTDNLEGAVVCPKDTLAVAESMTCTATGVAAPGQYANTGSVTTDQEVSDSDPSHYFGFVPAEPAIDIEKATNDQDADLPTGPQIVVGDTVTWTYVVKNMGNVALTGVAVTDNLEGAVVCPKDTLAVAESMTCTATGTATVGQYSNIGSVEGFAPDQTKVSDSDPSHYFGFVPAEPAIDIEKATNDQDADLPTGPQIVVGDTVTWTYVVKNMGNVALTGVAVTDNLEGAVVCPKDTLAVAESMTCTATGVAAPGQYANTGSVTTDQEVSDSDPSHYFGFVPAEPAIDIEKATNDQDADTPTGPQIVVGSTVTWTYVVKNTGNVALSSVLVTDDQGVAVSCPKDTLDVLESMTCTATGTATVGQYANIGSVEGYARDETPVTDSDPSHYLGYTPTTTPTTTPTLLGSIGDLVWEDSNSNGVQDAVEPGIAGVVVELFDADTDTLLGIRVTDANGNYLFDDLEAGDYYLVFTLPSADDKFIPPNVGANAALDSDADDKVNIGRTTSVITVVAGQDLTWDAGVAFVAVGGVQITTTTPETLPFTGANFGEGGMAGIALALLALGGVALLSVRRREEQTEVVATGWSGRLWDVE